MKALSANAFNKILLHPRYWATWCGVGIFWVLAWLPNKTRHWLGKHIGHFIYRKNHKRRHIVSSNLQHCFPELTADEHAVLAQQTMREYACALLDYSVLFFRSRKWLSQHVVIEGREKLDKALAQDQNIILLLGHSVWLEFAPLTIGLDYSAYGSYKPFKNPVVNWLIARSRLKDVEFVIAREEGMMKLVRAMKPGRLLFFLPDQDHGEKHSVFAPFFGKPKATLTTPARIVKLGKASCFPVMTFFDHNTGKYTTVISDKLEGFGGGSAEQSATMMNRGFQELISLHPEQYMWLLKLFRTTQDDVKNPY
uniref:Lipid A biosynthesis acyltransferase n=1 Tax=uncultured Thiotrichaceae bacterium TaxID=298394 RepID=A0A6S6TYD1_9GAMM|nr:MAG: Lipid A biosynthesis acyltransferase [uncultured Thiotrichaceae bacterium]